MTEEKKTVSERAKEKALEIKAQETAIQTPMEAPVSRGIVGLEGLEADDIQMPYVFLVRGSTENAVLANGENAAPGTFYHSVRKTATKSIEAIIIVAKKLDGVRKHDDGTEEPQKFWKTVMVATDNMHSPFALSFKGMNHWIGWKEFTTALVSEGIDSLHDTVVTLTAGKETMETKAGKRTYEVTKVTPTRETTAEEKQIAQGYFARFDSLITNAPEEEEAPQRPQVNAPTEVTDGDLNSLIKLIEEEESVN